MLCRSSVSITPSPVELKGKKVVAIAAEQDGSSRRRTKRGRTVDGNREATAAVSWQLLFKCISEAIQHPKKKKKGDMRIKKQVLDGTGIICWRGKEAMTI